MDRSIVKKFCRVDFNDDDWYFDLLIEAAKEYFNDSIVTYDDTKARHQLLLLNLVKAMYDERLYTVDKTNEKVSYVLKSMVLQLQLAEVIL